MFQILLFIVQVLGIIPILLLKVQKQTHETLYIKPFVWLLTFSVFYEVVATLILKINNIVWFRFYLLLEFYAVFYFFLRLFEARYKVYLISSASIFAVVFITLLFYWDNSNNLKTDSFLSVLEIIFVYCSSILWCKDLFNNLTQRSLLDYSIFYFIAGFILYFSGTLFLFLISDLIFSSTLNFENYWTLNIAFNILLRIFLIIGIWKGQQKSMQYSG